MKKSGLIAVSLFFIFLGSVAKAEDAASVSALADTQTMLQNPAQRNKIIKDNPTAQSVDASVKSLTGNSKTTDEVYQLAGKVLEDLVKETGGDPVKMMEIMSKAQTDPKSLMDHVSEQNKQDFHSVSSEIENSPTTSTRKPASSK
jgi:hypothetical protein